MNTAANAPKSPAKNNATLSFMVQDHSATRLPTLSLTFPLQLQWAHVTSTGRDSHSSCTVVHPLRKMSPSWFMICFWIFTPLLSLCLCYGSTRLSTWLFWTLLGSAASPPPGLFLGVWLNGCSSPMWGCCVWSSWSAWREGINAEITGSNWTPTVCTGMSGHGETERTEEGWRIPQHPAQSF